MNTEDNQNADKGILQFTSKLGVLFEKELEHFRVNFFKGFIFLPEMAMHFGSFFVKNSITRVTATSDITDAIGFVFYNIFEDKSALASAVNKSERIAEPPYVRIFPYAISQKIDFKKDTTVTHVSISISAGYLQSFLKEDAEHFQSLFNRASNFLMEEIMTDDILRTVNDIVKQDEPATLKSFYYKVKAMELLFYLFESLRKRENSASQKLTGKEIEGIYRVREKIVSSLSRSSSIDELKKIAGMNELKLRKLFKQVFGMGIYDYYQLLRMKEAARLMREEKFSVSEAGYKVGFENLGHFTKVFEKHIGKKPKRYMQSFDTT